MAIVRQNKLLLSVIACLFLAFLAFSLTSIYTRVDVDAEDVEAATADFDKIASATAAALNTEARQNNGIINWSTLYTGGIGGQDLNVGGLIAGYYNTDQQQGASYWFGSLNSSDSMSYKIPPTSSSFGANLSDSSAYAIKNLSLYYGFGAMLSKCGFDEVSHGGDIDPLRPVIGSIFSVEYFLSQGIDTFWDYVMSFLQFADPFRFFSTVGLNPSYNFENDSGMDALAEDTNNFSTNFSAFIQAGFRDIASVFSVIYTWLQTYALTIFLPLFLVFALFTWLVIHKGEQAGRTFKRLFIRVGYTCVAIPLGMCIYSTAVSIVADLHLQAGDSAANVLLSTFFDFEDFAKTNMFFGEEWYNGVGTQSYPIGYNISDNQLVDESYLNMKYICSRAMARMWLNDSTYQLNDLAFRPESGFTDWDQFIAKNQVNTVLIGDTRLSDLHVTTQSGGLVIERVKPSKVFDLLNRYSNGVFYLSSDHASYVRTKYRENHDDVATLDWSIVLAMSDNWRDYMCGLEAPMSISITEGSTSQTYVVSKDVLTAFNNNNTRLFVNSSSSNVYEKNLVLDDLQHAFKYDSGRYTMWTNGSNRVTGGFVGTTSDDNTEVASGTYVMYFLTNSDTEITSGLNTSKGLSDIATYNYLNSSFDNNTIIVGSSVNANSEMAKIQHYAVNIVGTGFIRVVFTLNSICILLAFIILGYYYGFGLLISSIKAMFKMIPALLTGTIGSIRGIATTIIILFTVIAEILGTCLLYSIAANFMYLTYSLFERPLVMLLYDLLSHNINDVNYFLIPLEAIISTVVTLFIVSKLIEYRYAICRSLAENAAAVVNKFFETNVSAPDLSAPASSFAGKAGNLALAAAGLAMGAEAAGEDVVGNIRDTAKSIGDKMGLSTGSSESGSTGDLDMDGGTDDGIKNADGTFDKSAGAGLGRTADEQAEDYVNSNKDNFLNNLDENLEDFADGSKGVVLTKDGIKTVSLEKSGDSSVISGDDSDIEVESPEDERHLIATSSGKPYTQEDYENGEAYSIVDGNGNVVDDENGKPITRMNPEGLQKTATGWSTNDTVFDSTGTRVPDFGNYEAPNGTTTHLVNSKGEAYTQADYASGAPATMVDGAGNVVPGMANIPATAIQSTANGVAITTPNGVVTMSPVGTMAGGAVPAFGQYILPNGSTAQVVNASTGAVYSQTDLAKGVPAAITDGTGRVIQSMSNIQPSAIQAVSNGLAVTAADGKLITMTSIGGAATNIVAEGIATPHTTYTSADMAGAAMAGGVVGAAFNMGYGAFTPNVTPTVTPNVAPMSVPVSPVGYNVGASSYAQPIYNTDRVPSGYSTDRSTSNTAPAYSGSGFDRNNSTVINNICANGVPTGSMQQGPVYNISESTGSRGESFSANISENITSSQITASNKANNTTLNVDNKREENVSESSETNEDNSVMSKLSNTLGAAIASAVTRGKDGKSAAQKEYHRNLRNNNK